MTKNEMLETISSCRKRIALADVLDRSGFHEDSERIMMEVMVVISSISGEGGFRRFAIRGYTSMDENIQSIMGGIGAGAGLGGTLGAGIFSIPGAAIGSAVGGVAGAVSGPLQDAWFRNVNGRLSRSMALSQDFARGAQKLAAFLQKSGNPEGAAAILQAAQILHTRVRQQYEGMKSQISQQMGISPEEDKRWYSSWLPKIQRYQRMMRAKAEGRMTREAVNQQGTEEEEAEYDPWAEAEEEFNKYKQRNLIGGTEELVDMFGKGLSGGSRSPSAVPGPVNPNEVSFAMWGVPTALSLARIRHPLLQSIGKAGGAVAGPLWAADIGGYIGGKAGSAIVNKLHGGGQQGDIRRLSGEMGQIVAEIEKQLGISFEDVKQQVYRSISGNIGNQFAGEFGTGYGQQSGNKQVEDYFRGLSRRTT